MESRAKPNIQQFNGERYSTWKFRIKSLLEELQVLCVIESTPPEKPDAEWTKQNLIAKSTIVEFLGDGFLNFGQDAITANSIMTT